MAPTKSVKVPATQAQRKPAGVWAMPATAGERSTGLALKHAAASMLEVHGQPSSPRLDMDLSDCGEHQKSRMHGQESRTHGQESVGAAAEADAPDTATALAEEVAAKLQQAIESILMANEAFGGTDQPEFAQAILRLQGETTPLARGAADAQKLVHIVLLRAPSTTDKFVKKAYRDVTDLVVLRCRACCTDPKDRDDFLAKAAEAYDGELDKEVRSQLLNAYSKDANNEKCGFLSNNRVAADRRGGPLPPRPRYNVKLDIPPPPELPPPPRMPSMDLQQLTSPAMPAEGYTKVFMLACRQADPQVLCGSASSNLPSELEFSTLTAKASEKEVARVTRTPDGNDDTQESLHAMDKLLHQCFLAAVSEVKVRQVSIPIKGTRLYVDHMRPNRPAGTSLDVKLSSFQSLAKYLEHLQNEGFLTLQPGLTDPLITMLHLDHPAFGPSDISPWSFPGKDTICSTWCNKQASQSKPPSAVTSLSLGASDLRPAWMQERTRKAAGKQQDADDTETPRTAVTTSRSTSSGDESNSNFGSCSSECKEGEVANRPEGPEVIAAEEAEPRSANAILLGACGWTTGDFIVGESYGSCMVWDGGESALEVVKDEMVYVSKVDEQGWAQAKSSSGKSGWLPAAILGRCVHAALAPYAGGPGYLVVNTGDRLAVYHRDGSWAYGARIELKVGGGDGQERCAADSEFRDWVLEEGWFPSASIAKD